MRNALLKTSAITALLIVSSFAFAQAPSEPNREESKKEKIEKIAPPAAAREQQSDRPAQSELRGESREQHKGATAQERSGTSEPTRAGNERPSKRNTAEESKKQSTTGQSGAEPTKREQTGAANDREKKAEWSRSSENKSEKKGAAPSAENADHSTELGKSKSTAGPAHEEQKKGAATQETPAQGQHPAAAQTNTQDSKSSSTTMGTNQSNSSNVTRGAQPNPATATNANHIPPEKQVEISRAISRTEVAPPERNLNVSINVGTIVSRRVHFHRLPREIWSIEPAYRDYSYFTTDEDIVIVEPHSHRVVSMIPRNASAARAQVAGGGSAPPCQVIRRDPSGQLTEVNAEQFSRSTTGSGGGHNPALTVTVMTNNGKTTQPISLDASAGQIVAATQGNGDCQITIEPQAR